MDILDEREARQIALKLAAAGREGWSTDQVTEAARRFLDFIVGDDFTRFVVGKRTMGNIFQPNGIRNLADMQAVLDAIEAHLAAVDQPDGPFLPPDLADAMRDSAYSQLYAVQLVLAERARQAAKGWTAEHDDAHTGGEIANEAAAALAVSRDAWDVPAVGWVDRDQPRVRQIVAGVALGLAELERFIRRDQAAEFRTHGADSAVDDELEPSAFDMSRDVHFEPAAGVGETIAELVTGAVRYRMEVKHPDGSSTAYFLVRDPERPPEHIPAPVTIGKAMEGQAFDFVRDTMPASYSGAATSASLAASAAADALASQRAADEAQAAVLGDEDFDNMHHALGRCAPELLRPGGEPPYRNYYVIDATSDKAARFLALGTWELARYINDGRDGVYTVNARGRDALAEWLDRRWGLAMPLTDAMVDAAERYLVPRPAAREMAVSIVKAALAAADTPPLGQTVYGR